MVRRRQIMPLSRDEYAKSFVDDAKRRGKSEEETKAKFSQAMSIYDKNNKPEKKGFIDTVKDAYSGYNQLKESGVSGRDIAGIAARGTLQDMSRNVGNEKNVTPFEEALLKGGQVAETAFPIVAGTVARIVGTPLGKGRQYGAVGTAAGQASGSTVRELTENIAGVQDDSSISAGLQPLAEGVVAGSVDYALDVVMEKASKIMSPIFKKGKEAVKQSKPGKFLSKITGKVSEWAKKTAAADAIAQMKLSKKLRKESVTRDLDLADEIFRTNNSGELIYGDDLIKNSKITDKIIKAKSELINRVLKANRNPQEVVGLIDDIIAKKMRTAGSQAEKDALIKFGVFTKNRLKEEYGGTVINSGAMLAEKIFAGGNGFKTGADVGEEITSQAYAALNDAYKEKILSNVSGANKILLKKLLREQEQTMLMKAAFYETAISNAPKTIKNRIGRLFFPTTLAAETFGEVASQIVESTAKPNLLTKIVGAPFRAGKEVVGAASKAVPSTTGTGAVKYINSLIGKK